MYLEECGRRHIDINNFPGFPSKTYAPKIVCLPLRVCTTIYQELLSRIYIRLSRGNIQSFLRLAAQLLWFNRDNRLRKVTIETRDWSCGE